MLEAIEELKRSKHYHKKQLEENIHKVQSKTESIELLKTANEKHLEIMDQIDEAIKALKDIAVTMPIGKDSIGIIPEKGEM